MRSCGALFVLIFCGLSSAQTVPQTAPGQLVQPTAATSIELAREQVDRMQKLVDAGALPKIRLDDAARDLADAQDRAILDRTLYGNTPVENLTEQMGSDMVAAAQRRLDRQKERIAEAGKLVDDGILARNSIQPLQDELALRQNALQLAQSRANLIGEM